MSINWKYRLAFRTDGMKSSIIRELLKLTQDPELISFAGGLPAPELFPVERFIEASQKVLKEHGAKALQYSPTEGYVPLRELIAGRMNDVGIPVSAGEILITSGSQQALDLTGEIFLDPGDTVLLERPSYLGAIQAWAAYQVRFVGAEIDRNGVIPEALLEGLKASPKFMYILPNFQNPGGTTLAADRREMIVEKAREFGVPVVEDDPYGSLRFEGEPLPPLAAIDARSNGGSLEHVIYLGTFSKILAPGLRLGWVAAKPEVLRYYVQGKQGQDLHTSTFTQMVAYEVAKDGFLEEHIKKIQEVYGHRRDVMVAAMKRYFPEGVTWTVPQGGLFLWATLPDGMDTEPLFKQAIEEKVAFVPGYVFYAPEIGKEPLRNSMRLNFSNARPEMIEEGIRRLGRAIEKMMG
jgi:2-aminoadipate transaminase